jgi:DNA-binding transcriptional regulator YiaG
MTIAPIALDAALQPDNRWSWSVDCKDPADSRTGTSPTLTDAMARIQAACAGQLVSQDSGKNVGKLIAASRRAAKLTQAQLANCLSTTRSAVAQWESGYAHPTVKHLLQIAQVLDITPNQLLKGA